MVAVHQGALQLRHTAPPAVLAAGINLILSEAASTAAQVAGMLAPDARCKTLDATASGYVRAEACSALWLTVGIEPPSSLATVLLQSTHVNQDGRSSSLTAPNGPSQQVVIHGALLAASLHPLDIGSLEMHGTGELQAARWTCVYDEPRSRQSSQDQGSDT